MGVHMAKKTSMRGDPTTTTVVKYVPTAVTSTSLTG